MRKESFKFLTDLLETEAPSGFEQPIQRVVKKYVKSFADEVRIDVHGNLIAAVNPDAPVRVMLAGHCDQIGMMVTFIDERGFICFQQIGGLDPSVVPGSSVSIVTKDGVIPGVIGYKPIHLIPQKERGRAVKLDELWIDIGAKDQKEAQSRVQIGDPVTYQLGVRQLSKHVISSPGCDDRVGAFTVMEALRLFAESDKSDVALFAVSTVQEEIGLRGAKTSCYGIDPQAGIAVDVAHASDNPGAEARKIGTLNLGDGPGLYRGANINPVLGGLLIDTAEKKKVKHQLVGYPRGLGTDANAMQVSRSGVAAAHIGIPNRYMHTPVEVVDLRDIEAAASLIAHSMSKVTKKTSFIPS